MKKALIYFRDILAGRLAETEDGYEFQYESTYLARPQAEPISLT
ncbi:MAG: HipA N-terminal domain-containing protein, partial [Bacteroidales bacterium]|nr:HipA N-terminal domain-containing protein [Bacteroidales bacterium]